MKTARLSTVRPARRDERLPIPTPAPGRTGLVWPWVLLVFVFTMIAAVGILVYLAPSPARAAGAPAVRRVWPQILVTSHAIQYGVASERGYKRTGPEPLDKLRAHSGKIFLEDGLVPAEHLNDGITVKEIEAVLWETAVQLRGDPTFDGYVKIVVDKRATMGTVGQVVNTARFCGFIKPDTVVAPNDLEDGRDYAATWSDPESI